MTQTREPFLTPKEVALYLTVSPMTVYRRIADGSLRAYRFGKSFRIPLSALNAYVDASRMDGDW